jgi:hypothetical protein
MGLAGLGQLLVGCLLGQFGGLRQVSFSLYFFLLSSFSFLFCCFEFSN